MVVQARRREVPQPEKAANGHAKLPLSGFHDLVSLWIWVHLGSLDIVRLLLDFNKASWSSSLRVGALLRGGESSSPLEETDSLSTSSKSCLAGVVSLAGQSSPDGPDSKGGFAPKGKEDLENASSLTH